MNQTSSRHNMFYLNGWLATAMLAGAPVLIAMALFSTVGVLAAPLFVFILPIPARRRCRAMRNAPFLPPMIFPTLITATMTRKTKTSRQNFGRKPLPCLSRRQSLPQTSPIGPKTCAMC